MQNVPLISFSENISLPICEKDKAIMMENGSFESFLDKEMEATSEIGSDSSPWKKILEEMFCSLESVLASSLEAVPIPQEKINENILEQDFSFIQEDKLQEKAMPLAICSMTEALPSSPIAETTLPSFPIAETTLLSSPIAETLPSSPIAKGSTFFPRNPWELALLEKIPELKNQEMAIVENKQTPHQGLSLNNSEESSMSKATDALFISNQDTNKVFDGFPKEGNIQKEPLSIGSIDKESPVQENREIRTSEIEKNIVWERKETTEFVLAANQNLEKSETGASDKNSLLPFSDFLAFHKKNTEGNSGKFFFSLEKSLSPLESQENISSLNTSLQTKPETDPTIQYENTPSFLPHNLKVQKAILYVEKEEKKIQIHLQLQGENLEAQFITTDAKTVSILESQLQNLKDSLQKEGINLTESKILLTDGNSFSRERSQKENSRLIFLSRSKKTQEIESRQGYSHYQWVSYPGRSRINCYT